KKEKISLSIVDKKVKRILMAKNWAVLPIKQPGYNHDSIYNHQYRSQKKNLIANAVTAIKNSNSLLPLRQFDTLKMAAVAAGPKDGSLFQNTTKLYHGIDLYNLKETPLDSLRKHLKSYNLVILSIHTDDYRAYRNYGIDNSTTAIIDSICTEFPTLLVSFAQPYLLQSLKALNQCKAIVITSSPDDVCQHTTAQSIFGAYPINGTLPVTVSNDFQAGFGLFIPKLPVLSYVEPYEAGINEESLLEIDSIVNGAIKQQAMPGCQVLAARHGKVFFHKAYGNTTYKGGKPITVNSIYDIASITKIAATLPVLMHMYDNKKIDITDKLSDYLSGLDTTDKADIRIDDILLHQAGLFSWIPFYLKTIEPILENQDLYSTRYSKTHPIQVGRYNYLNKHIRHKPGYITSSPDWTHSIKVAENIYVGSNWQDTIFLSILSSELGEKGDYVYSDLGFILFYHMIKEQMDYKLETLSEVLFYEKMGAYTMGYHPDRQYKSFEDIAPTENDVYFRKQVVRGYVHDPAAAMMGGASGHAGLFSNANDLAKLMQMYMNGGRYGSYEFLKEETIQEFIERKNWENENRRGLGFDKPTPDSTKATPTCESASYSSYGHTGFTGTATWADPETGILYVFLSNRVYPDAVDNKLLKLDVRTNIQEVLYKALIQ
ncbi:MAG: serine hydrolase, partial [Bacteroidales bacterium]|nr:serine hydrolase [Bacteroidales bacterium]